MRSEEIIQEALVDGHLVPCLWIAKQIDLENIPEITFMGDFSKLPPPPGEELDRHCWQYLIAKRREQRWERERAAEEAKSAWIPDAGPIFENPYMALELPKVRYGSLLKQKRGDYTYLLPAVYLIFNESGELVYIGQTRKLCIRLEQHIIQDGVNASFLRHLAIDVSRLPTHRCPCGRKITCKTSFRSNSKTGRELMWLVKDKFEVAPISTTEERLLELEHLLQVTLKPKYMGRL